MNLNKLDLMLCLAFQESEGPFNVEVKFYNPLDKNTQEIFILSKQEIRNVSMWDEIKSISIVEPFKDRRWRIRTR